MTETTGPGWYEATHGAANSAPRWTVDELAETPLVEVVCFVVISLVPVIVTMVT